MAVNLFKQKVKLSPDFLYQAKLVNPLDDFIAKKEVQRSLAQSKSSRTYLRYIERRTTLSYVNVINYLLYRVLNKLTLDDLLNAPNFAEAKKMSLTQSEYINSCNLVVRFVKLNVILHKNQEAKLNAIVRWIEVAEELLQLHNYEGFFQVTSALLSSDIRKLYLIKYLPSTFQNKLEHFEELINPLQKFKVWKEFVGEQAVIGSCPIIGVLARDASEIKERLGGGENDAEQQQALKTRRARGIAKVLYARAIDLPKLDSHDKELLQALKNTTQKQEKLLWAKAQKSSLNLIQAEKDNNPPKFYHCKNPGFFTRVGKGFSNFGHYLSTRCKF